MKFLITLLMLCASSTVPFYSLIVKSNTVSDISFEDFRGKPVLIVNTASNSSDSLQFYQLEELYQHFNGKLIVLVVPTNDFGNEPLNDVGIKSLLENRYNAHYLITQKNAGSDSLKNSLLEEWLTHKDQNRMANSVIKGDFFKYLINGAGQIIGIFSNEVKPMDRMLLDVIPVQ